MPNYHPKKADDFQKIFLNELNALSCFKTILQITHNTFTESCTWISSGGASAKNNDKVVFIYADDMESKSAENRVKQKLSTESTSPEFYLSDAIWITCKSIKYIPHTNEFGPRTLLA